jgi:hypothetical protein
MTTNLDTRGGRLERLAKLAQSALVEDLNRMVARESNRNRERPCPPTMFKLERCAGLDRSRCHFP